MSGYRVMSHAVVRTLIQSAFLSSAKPEWDRWFGPRDERAVAKASGGTPWPSGVDGRLSVRAVYAVAVALVAANCLVGTFSGARDVSWRISAPHNLWEPALWYCTSGIVVVALLPLARRGAMLLRGVAVRPFAVTVAVISLAFVFSGLHIIGMGVLRELAYAAGGWTYKYPWAEEIPYELRKDLFSYVGIAVLFWLAKNQCRACGGRYPGGAGPPSHARVLAPRRSDENTRRPQRDRVGKLGRELCGIRIDQRSSSFDPRHTPGRRGSAVVIRGRAGTQDTPRQRETDGRGEMEAIWRFRGAARYRRGSSRQSPLQSDRGGNCLIYDLTPPRSKSTVPLSTPL
jgi:hypothetical protein